MKVKELITKLNELPDECLNYEILVIPSCTDTFCDILEDIDYLTIEHATQDIFNNHHTGTSIDTTKQSNLKIITISTC